MFHRKRRASSNPPVASNPTPSAALAASQAFLKDRESNASLSSAAAAAALRTHTRTPTPVGEVQTKRMERRASTSSAGSAPGGRQGSPRRQNSNGSMSERTFRSPSPSPSRNHVTSPSVPEDAPPVPALPKDAPDVPARSHRVSSIQDPRVASPVSKNVGRAASLDRAGANPSTPSPQPGSQGSKPAGQRTSINFSRPMSPPVSPAASPRPATHAGHSGWLASPAHTEGLFKQSAAEKVKASGAGGLATSKWAFGTSDMQSMGAMKKKRPVQPAQGPHTSSAATAAPKAEPTLVYDPNSRTFRPVVPPQPPPQPAVARSQPPRQPASKPVAIQPARTITPSPEPPRPAPPRTSGHLQKQPSVVHEDREREEEEEEDARHATIANTGKRVDSIQSQAQPPTQSKHTRSFSMGISPPKPLPAQADRPRSASAKVAHPTGLSENPPPIPGRGASLSPSRSTRFSPTPVDMSSGIIHQPPPRSLSPAKSAMKRSPSRGDSNSPNADATAERSASLDMSETVSDEGLKSARRKSVRVSFEEPEIIGEGFGPLSPIESDIVHREVTAYGAPDNDGILSPTPMLPSFGSIRGRRQTSAEALEKVTETVPSSMSTSVSTAADDQGVSNDHAVGGILAHDLASKSVNGKPRGLSPEPVPPATNEPLPPEVTSVEGTGYVSESEYSDDIQLTTTPEPPESPPAVKNEPSTYQPAIAQAAREPAVPSIEILPATPAVPEQSMEESFIMPGGFPDFEDEPVPAPPAVQHSPTDPTPSSIGLSEPTPADVKSPGHPTTFTAPAAESSEGSDHSSIYSDAAEDLSDLEQEQYASLDAIVDSPMMQPSSGPADSALSESPSVSLPTRATAAEDKSLGSHGDWSKTKAYWSRLSEQRRREAEEEAFSGDIADTEQEPSMVPNTAKPRSKKKRASMNPVPPEESAQNIDGPFPTMSKPTRHRDSEPQQTERRMRQSMRSPPPEPQAQAPGTHLRSSMRTGGQMPATMRNKASEKPKGREKQRPFSPPAAEPRGTLQKRHIPSHSLDTGSRAVPAKGLESSKHRPQTAAAPPVSRPLDDGAESDSSFRKHRPRPSTATEDGKYTMRRSMRDGARPDTARPATTARVPSPPPAGKTKSTRFSLRSLSPNSSFMGRAARNPRASADSGTPTLRSQDPKKPKGFGKAATRPKTASIPKPKLGFISRFEDSSDEDSPALNRPMFRSRFADSDDDLSSPVAMPTDLTPVRGIPRKAGDEDRESTDLEDEDDEDLGEPAPPSSKDVERGITSTNGKAQATALGTPSVQADGLAASKHAPPPVSSWSTSSPTFRKSSKRRSFFGIGRQKKDKSAVSGTSLSPIKDTIKEKPSTPPPAETSTPAQAPSTAEGTPTSTTDRPRSPKLQRRRLTDRDRVMSDSWPLPPPNPAFAAEEQERPATADGTPADDAKAPTSPARPQLAKRVSAAMSFGSSRAEGREPIVSSRTGRKKRFQGLRRVFKLDD